MNEVKSPFLKHADFMFLDILILECLYLVLAKTMIRKAQWIRFGVHEEVAFLIPFTIIILFFLHNFYRDIIRRPFYREIISSVAYMSCISIVIMAFLYFTKGGYLYSRKLFGTFYATGICVLICTHKIYKKFVIKHIKKVKCVYVCQNPVSPKEIEDIQKQDMSIEIDHVFKSPIDKEEFNEYRNAHTVDAVIMDTNQDEEDYFMDSGLPVYIRIDTLFDVPNPRMEVRGKMVVIEASHAIAMQWELILKRIMDIVGSIIGLIITGIAFLIFAPIIKKQSPGPVFYTQIRVGKNGKQFKFYKFRSMYPDADARKAELMKENKINGAMFKIDNDPRIIPIGHFMRKHSIDELPQFYNVLKGDMSLVGTRPPTLEEWEAYSSHHRARLSAKPGLTGVWQVSGRSDITNFEDVVEMDMQYIRGWTISKDIHLILKTIVVVIKGTGAR